MVCQSMLGTSAVRLGTVPVRSLQVFNQARSSDSHHRPVEITTPLTALIRKNRISSVPQTRHSNLARTYALPSTPGSRKYLFKFLTRFGRKAGRQSTTTTTTRSGNSTGTGHMGPLSLLSTLEIASLWMDACLCSLNSRCGFPRPLSRTARSFTLFCQADLVRLSFVVVLPALPSSQTNRVVSHLLLGAIMGNGYYRDLRMGYIESCSPCPGSALDCSNPLPCSAIYICSHQAGRNFSFVPVPYGASGHPIFSVL
ncbi:hypothetical protein V8F20_012096 [Naviculisporaceae sp. PSN 640]